MPLSSGTRLGPYEIIAPLGAGGMGEVYRARDSRLGREVAIKVLHANVSLDADRLRRFEQEARAAAALNHPNILAVFDIGDRDGSPYIVSELLEGETLREQLLSGALPVRRALDIAVQVAQGLAAAHDKGIVHRDLKPENIFITNDGRAKILDFGLAKLRAEGADGARAAGMTPEANTLAPSRNVGPSSHQDNLTTQGGTPHTEPGLVFGTVGYMAPEQIRSQPVDARTDIFAFGAVLYELLTGRRAFQRDTPAETMTAILREDPPELQSDASPIPPGLRRIVDRCLAKSPSGRFKSADDLAFALGSPSDGSGARAAESASNAPSTTSSLAARAKDANAADAAADDDTSRRRDRKGTRPRGRWFYRALAVVAVVGLFRLGPGLVRALRPALAPERKPVVRLQLSLPDGAFIMPGQPPAVSPDGSEIAVIGVDQASGKRQVYLRRLDSLAAQPIAGTERAIYPFWSPEGRSLAFFASGVLKTVELPSGTVRTVCRVDTPGGQGVWVGDTIFFSRIAGTISRVTAQGGTPLIVTVFDGQSHMLAGVLPDRSRVLYSTFTQTLVTSNAL
jgi:serine/threonine protein kinase